MPCPACNAEGLKLIEYASGQYRKVECKWCDYGATDKETAMMFERWLSIRRANKCPSDD